MKVKPFYIKTSNLTEMQIADAIELSINHGADRCEGVDGINQDGYISPLEWVFFGVDGENDTYFSDDGGSYGLNAVEITLDQLDVHLGISDSEGWNGEGLPPVGVECELLDECGGNIWIPVVVKYSSKWGVVVESVRTCTGVELFFNISDNKTFRKPETQQQRQERERLEAIETMCNEVDKLPHGEAFAAMATLYDLGYRKQ